MNARAAMRLSANDSAAIELIAKAIAEGRATRGEPWSVVTVAEVMRTALQLSAQAARAGTLAESR